MPKRHFPNQLRTIRRRSGLSQDEVAFLLEGENGGMVSRYEQFNRMPSLETACALEALFGIPVRQLFAGTFAEASARMAKRVRVLEQKLQAPGRLTAQKLNTLRSVSMAQHPTTQL
ncbi:MAG TPA: helix-turn-helix transcriptional regulator [Terriglobia bacterium]|nr:helix-turn-helix transcriptional regulator [Terriglobia bacterium]